MKQFTLAYEFNRSVTELNSRIRDTLSAEPTWSVHTISMVTYDCATGRNFSAIVVYNVDRPQDTLDVPKLSGDVWDNGYRLPVNEGPIPCARKSE